MSNIGERIRDMRIARGLSQQELADKMGYLSRASITRIESGIRSFPQEKLNDFAVALDTTAEYLLYGEDREDIANIISGKDLLRGICRDSPKAQELLERMNITDTGDISVEGIDLTSAAVIGHAMRGLLSALQSAQYDENGKAKVVIKVNDLLPKEKG